MKKIAILLALVSTPVFADTAKDAKAPAADKTADKAPAGDTKDAKATDKTATDKTKATDKTATDKKATDKTKTPAKAPAKDAKATDKTAAPAKS